MSHNSLVRKENARSNTKRHFYPNDVTATPIRFQSDIIGGVLSSAKLFDIAWVRIPQKHTVSKNMPGTIKLEFQEVTLCVTVVKEL